MSLAISLINGDIDLNHKHGFKATEPSLQERRRWLTPPREYPSGRRKHHRESTRPSMPPIVSNEPVCKAGRSGSVIRRIILDRRQNLRHLEKKTRQDDWRNESFCQFSQEIRHGLPARTNMQTLNVMRGRDRTVKYDV